MSTVAKITLAELDRLIASGYFAREDRQEQRIELIEGELRPMNPIGDLHAEIVDILNAWSQAQSSNRGVRIRCQNPIGIPELDSAPEPDIAWVKRRSYRRGRPERADVFLIIEVSESTLRYDRGLKARLYARAGIADYWVVDVNRETIEVFRKPVDGRYTEQTVYRGEQAVSPLVFPEMTITPAALFAEEMSDEGGAE